MNRTMLANFKVILILAVATSISAKSIIEINEIDNKTSENDSPIIGVLAQEIAYSLEQIYPGQYKSFIAASYVKFVEGGGGRVVPVWIGQKKEYYEDVVKKTNGILMPGGATWFNQSCGYADAGVTLYNLAIEENKKGNYYPVFGTCLGMELLIYAAADSTEYRPRCSASNIGLPLEFKPDYKKSKMYNEIPDKIATALKTENITANFHGFCVTEQNLVELNLTNDWHVSSVNKDKNNLEFISSFEHKRYPFYGVQFHPEKNLYEWLPKAGVIHSKNAVVASQYYAQFFVNEARKSKNKYASRAAEQEELIYNYPVKYTGRDGGYYEQCYLFGEDKMAQCGDTNLTTQV